ncbi:hypothetical protein AYO21_01569 [Fonsecaea monophora]|uniref:Xylanolytic transcriptional activator regulatory domain-containing protein n=1 Tax=Fonsecaea monophora TaxID=254056 RepID=A0A177FLB4_9EURO|nr:hypothetical protein AYO21_01569 [Fonsecaea monophora]KAH0835351.1 fungal specific transcription factor domain protein [Fonsecaea pedrosoi]OAG44112.1 hypothetical protein AYO21_01569 [Fonsecaea monophora]
MPEMLYARMTEDPSEAKQIGLADGSRTLYLGEAFMLTFVVKTVCSPSGRLEDATKVHYPVPPSVDDGSEHTHELGRDLEPAVLAFLRSQGAFVVLEQQISDELVRIFFSSLHPAYAVYDRRDFIRNYRCGSLSMLALQVVYLLASTIAPEQLLKRAGFSTRAFARNTFYQRAKTLYDMNYERDKTQLVAALFLLGFWWPKPEDPKDSWHWLGCAISLAQTLGMHRSTVLSNLEARYRSLWKRIWWAIYTRDRHAAAALGRPFRIRDDDCDIEPLSPRDFDADIVSDDPLICTQEGFHVSYAIEMSKLAVLQGQILAQRYSPRPSCMITQVGTIPAELREWKARLPATWLRQPLSSSLDNSFWASMLFAAYNYALILLYRPTCVLDNTSAEAEHFLKATSAADEITRIAEDLLAAGTLGRAQLHMVPCLFAALGIHAIGIRRKDVIRGKLAENRSRQCMLALSELAEHWPVAGWILRLFISLIMKLTGKDFGLEISSNWAISQSQAPGMNMDELSVTRGTYLDYHQSDAPHASALSPSMGVQIQDIGMNPQAGVIQEPLSQPSAFTPLDLSFYDFDFIFQDSLAGFAGQNLSEHIDNICGST